MEARALILAAGVGSRMKSSKPKVAHELLGKPLVRWAVDAARAAGCEQVHVVTGTGREVVDPLVADCVVSHQDDMWGTGHTVMCAADALAGFSGCLVVMCGDTPLVRAETVAALVAAHEEAQAACTVLTMQLEDPHGYGRIVRGAAGHVVGIVEEKDCAPEQRAICECNSGMYCFDCAALLERLPRLTRNNAQGEYYLTDILGLMVEDGLLVEGVAVADNRECLGVNSRAQLEQVARLAQARINAAWMEQGVAMWDASQVWIGPEVQLAQDVELLPQTILMGSTQVGEGSVLGPNTRLTDTIVGENCTLEETVAVQARLGSNVTCGPRAYLRPGANICSNAHIGTSVEIKKSTVGEGSKVPHLAYIGDTEIGAGVNIGAGTITCNYDGFAKHKTVIEDGAFIGSDTILVAPVTVGEGAITGAASCIAKDVPAGALAIERSQQKTFEGWATKRAAQKRVE